MSDPVIRVTPPRRAAQEVCRVWSLSENRWITMRQWKHLGPCVSEEIVSCRSDGHRVICTFSTQDQQLAPLHMKSAVSWAVDQGEPVFWSKHRSLVSWQFFSSIQELCIPKSVQTIPNRCFCSCRNLFRITFAPGSS